MPIPHLPDELYTLIATYLCHHCQHPTDFPTADSPTIRTYKSTLYRLCLTSKRLLSIAQPILYHYYATGNTPGPLNPSYPHHNCVDDKLPIFLESIINRSDLARQVRGLQLQEIWNTCPDPVLTGEQIRLFNLISEGARITTPFPSHYTVNTAADLTHDKASDNRVAVHKWLRMLALRVASNTTMLLYGENPKQPLTYIRQHPQTLFSLTTLKFSSGAMGCCFGTLPALLYMAPNVTSLHISDFMNYIGHTLPLSAPAGIPQLQKMPGIRTLVGEGIAMETFGTVVGWCEGLREVEFYYDGHFYGTQELVSALTPVKGGLKKLVYMHISSRLPSYRGIDPPYKRTLGKSTVETIESLHELEGLEELVIDQWAISSYEPRDGSRQRLITQLPPSIRSVHFRYVYKSMHVELQLLAVAAGDRFPNLRKVRIDVVDDVNPEEREKLERMRQVEVSFGNVGVEVEWGVEASYNSSPTSETEISPTTVRGWRRAISGRFSSLLSNYLPN